MSTSTWRDLTAQQLATARPRRVLLVEDDDVYVTRLRRTLLDAAPQSFSLTVTPTLAEALSALGADSFDIVLLDLGLPDEQGARTYESIRRAVPHTPVCIVTSSDDPDLAAYTLYLGAVDYLIKDASDDLVLHVIGRAISRYRPYGGGLDRELELPPLENQSLAEVDQALFASLVGVYSGIVDLAIRAGYLNDATSHRPDLRTLANRLGRARASARDALAIHKAAIEARMRINPADANRWIHEASTVALELLAMLTEFYRERSPVDA